MARVDVGPTLVTGGAGFIGSHLCDRLLEQGVTRLVALDDLSTGSKANVLHWMIDPRFTLLIRDVAEPIPWEGPLSRIYHLACPASPVHYSKDPVQTIRTAAIGTWQALELCRRTGARLLIASTSEVYGDPQVHPQPESYRGNVNPGGPRSCYDEGKRCGESLAAAYRRQHGLDLRIARIFNTYGPRMTLDDGRVVTNFGSEALRGRPLQLYGDGNQTRSFCYVSDTLEGLQRLMEADDPGGPVNIGNPDERPIREVAELI
ncbi:MAG: NAD-dependent epimerase/dehydratase family protein, partial [Deltaproteobacteria bacterium]|nr:NAD-dependent epimerase/dehydratase family protein [Deltaproteobacteria bacterium]